MPTPDDERPEWETRAPRGFAGMSAEEREKLLKRARALNAIPVGPEETAQHEHEEAVIQQIKRLRAADEAREYLKVENLQEEIDEIDLARALRRGDDVITTVENDFLVRGRIPEIGLVQLAAQYYQGKSLLAVSLAMSVANGWSEWLGYPIDRKGPIMYIAAEATKTVEVAMNAWLVKNGGSMDQVGLVSEEFPVDFTSDACPDMMDQALEYIFADEPPVLVIGDTQIDMVGDSDENSIELGRAVRRMRQWAVKNQLLLMMVHHAGHDGERARGHSSQLAKADGLVFIHPHETSGDLKELEWQKVKGAQKPEDREQLVITPVPGTGGAVIEQTTATVLVAKAAATDWDLYRRIWDTANFIKGSGELITRSKICEEAGGNRNKVMRAIREMVSDGYFTADGPSAGGQPSLQLDHEPEEPDPT